MLVVARRAQATHKWKGTKSERSERELFSLLSVWYSPTNW